MNSTIKQNITHDRRGSSAAYFKKLLLYTEGVNSLIILPVSMIGILYYMNIREELIFPAVLYAVSGALILTMISSMTAYFYTKPLRIYFKKKFNNDLSTPKEIEQAEKRFRSVRCIHAASGIVKWLLITAGIILLSEKFASTSITGKINITAIIAVDILICWLLYLSYAEHQLNKLSESGIISFSGDRTREFTTKKSLTKTISFSVITVIISIAIITIALFQNIMEKQIKKGRSLDMLKSAVNIDQSIEKRFQEIERTVTAIAGSNEMKRVASSGDRGGIEQFLANTSKIYESCNAMFLLSPEKNSRIIASSVSPPAGTSMLPPENINMNITESLSGRTYLGSAWKSPLDNRPVMTITAPVLAGKQIIGILGMHIDLAVFNEMLMRNNDFNEFSDILVMDMNFKVIFHKNPGNLMNDVSHMKWISKITMNSGDLKFREMDKGEWTVYSGVKNLQYNLITSIQEKENGMELAAWDITKYIAVILLAGLLIIIIIMYQTIKGFLKPLRSTRDIIHLVSGGDLKGIIQISSNDEIGEIQDSLARLIAHMNSSINNIKKISDRLTGSTEIIAGTASAISENAGVEAEKAGQITSAVNSIADEINEISANVSDQYTQLEKLIQEMDFQSGVIGDMNTAINISHTINKDILSAAGEGTRKVINMKDIMMKISKSSEEMTGIIGIISEISDGINILSLNAAIESARAGEYGRGFAVVAKEISRLADQTSKSLGEIDLLIKSNSLETKNGITEINRVIDFISAIINDTGRVNETVHAIAGSMEEQLSANRNVNARAENIKTMADKIKSASWDQKEGMKDITMSINEINQKIQINASSTRDLETGTAAMREMALNLNRAVGYFSTKNE